MLKVQLTPSASSPPTAERVPAGMVTWYSVALGRRSISSESYWKVSVFVPRFEFTQAIKLNDTLKAMGMKQAFDPREADFSHMLDDKRERLFISAVVHKAFVSTDENGTEAAAATAVVMARATAIMDPQKPVTFRADRPFVFVIRHNKTGAVLFMGRVADPRAEE